MEPKDILNNIEQYYILNQKKDHLLDTNNMIAILKLNEEQIINAINNLEKKVKELDDTIIKTINTIITELGKVYDSKYESLKAFRAAEIKKYNNSIEAYESYKKKMFKKEEVLIALENEVSRNRGSIDKLDLKHETRNRDYEYICDVLNKGINDDSVINEELKEKIINFIYENERDNIIGLYNNLLELLECKKELTIEISNKVGARQESKKEIEELEITGNLLKEELENSKEIDIRVSLIELSNILNKVNEHDKIIKDIKNFLTKCGGFTTEIYKKAGSAVKVATSVASGNAEEVFDTCVDEIGNSLGIDPKITSNGKVLAKNVFGNLKKMKNEKKENKQDNNEE